MKIDLTIFGLVVVIGAMAAANIFLPAPQCPTVTPLSDFVNIRSAAVLRDNIIRRIAKGQTIEVESIPGSAWLKLRDGSGYVHSSVVACVDVLQTPTRIVTNTPTPAPSLTPTVTATSSLLWLHIDIDGDGRQETVIQCADPCAWEVSRNP